jgi:hypothetical protein
MIEIEIDDVLVAFDGRVLEFWRQGMGGSERFLATKIRPTVEGPGRNGFYQINFESTFGPGGFLMFVPEDRMADMKPLLDGIEAARAETTT